MANPACEVKNGAAAYVATTNGVDITGAVVIVIRLVSQADLQSWSISCATADELSDVAAINASLVIDSVACTATFTAPASTGRALRFQSRVNNGRNANNEIDLTYTTYFVLYTLVGGLRVHALDEAVEGNTLTN